MYLIKRFASQFILLAIICLIATLGYVKEEFITVDASFVPTRKIIIDAGHGGLTNTIN